MSHFISWEWEHHSYLCLSSLWQKRMVTVTNVISDVIIKFVTVEIFGLFSPLESLFIWAHMNTWIQEQLKEYSKSYRRPRLD